ncbi:Non-histone chromosomal MC1 family protein [Halosimplex carlsbadense 2-9-1]|uniref:Non-histone chromosomal MC1 family protein n=1 Tax=Halosimplex carlsbadense 2-9-1 TaxID=797114 RepID=M0D1T2_9EURY|nr:non-histone chromosomal MC1 family protein [Halosimplex carlsbadense]ELZ29466.1 Non-histone chromosomal MC1 family protein [Halosimplex carlsbadense 2-9-1]
MAPDSDKRNFALRTENGEEDSVFSGSTPRQAALKAARRLDPASSEDAAERESIRLREKGTHKVHIYEGWSWKESPPDVDMNEWDAEDPSDVWMNEVDEITKANVSKQGVEHLDDI